MHQPSIFVSSGLFAALFAAALLPAPAAFGFTFAKDGKASAAIVLPEDPGPSVRYAGAELAKYLGKMTGASFRVQHGEGNAVAGPKILLGFPYESQKPEEVCVRLRSPDVLEVTGEGARGPLYAVYNLLEGLGCGFWTPEIETVPSKPTLDLPAKFGNYKYAPPFLYRQPLANNTWKREWRPKVYINGDMWMLWAEAKPETGGAYPMQMGQWAAFIPKPAKDQAFFAARQDWLAFRRDGGRTPEGLCLTHPDLIAYVAQKIKEDQAKNPRLAYYNYSLGDNDKYCQCKRCEAILRKEGGASGLILHGANAIGRLIAADAPRARMMCLAYWPTRQPPRHLKPEPNVFIAAAMLRDFTKTASANSEYWAMLQGWSKLTKGYFFIWDYSCNFKSMLTPTPYIDLMGPTFRDYRKIGVKGVFSQMIGQRLSEMTQEESCPFFQAFADDGQYMLSKTKDCFELVGIPKEGRDMETLQALIREAKRVREFGFTATEYARAQADYLSALEKAYTNRDKRKNAEFGNEYRDHFLNNDPIPPLDILYQIMQQIVPNIPVQAINELAKELISDSDKNLVVMEWAQEADGKQYPTEQDMAAAVAAARAEQLQAYVDNVKDEPLVDVSKIKKGKIKKETENKVLGYKELTLSNGATVILKKTDFKDDEVQMQAFAKGGKSKYGEADYANLKVFDQVIGYSGIGNFSSTELTKALAGKEVNADATMGNTRQYVTAHSTPKDLETMFQMQYLYFTAINKDEKQFQNLMTTLDMALKNKALSPDAVFSDSLTNTLNAHNARFANLDVKDLPAVNYDRILQIAKERFQNAGQFTFVFTGNFDEQAIRPLIEQYVASLPATKQKAEDFNEIMTFAKGEVLNRFTVKTESPKATAVEVWYSDMPYTLENEVKLDAVGQLLSMIYLKTIREEESAAYSCGAQGYFNLSSHQPKAMLQAYCPMNPDKQELAIRLLHEGIDGMTKEVNADELSKVKETMLKQYDINVKRNGYWINILTSWKDYGLDFYTDYRKTVEALTVNSVRDFLNTLLKSGNHTEVIMLPEAEAQPQE